MSTNVLATVFLMLILTMSVSAVATSTTTTYATTGMGNCRDEPVGCTPQKDRVGADNDDPDNDSEDADRDGPGGDDGVGQETDNDEGEANCWGKVTSSLTQNDDDQPGIGEHSSDPVPNDGDNETPREVVGNQREGHPSDHADTVGGSEELHSCQQ